MNTKSLVQSSRILLAAGVSCLLLQSASATVLFTEAFNYTDGSGLGGQVNPGNSTAWTSGNSGLTITNVNLTYAGLADQGGNALVIQNASAGSTVNTYANQTAGSTYYSFLFDPLVINSANFYVTALNPAGGAPNGGSDAVDFQYFITGAMRLRANAAAATGTTVATIGTTYLVVLRLDLTGHQADMWINPDASSFGLSAPAATTTIIGTAATITSLNDVGFKAQTGTGRYIIDNLIVGQTWADVTPVSVPEPSTFVLMGFGCLSLIATVISRRRS